MYIYIYMDHINNVFYIIYHDISIYYIYIANQNFTASHIIYIIYALYMYIYIYTYSSLIMFIYVGEKE